MTDRDLAAGRATSLALCALNILKTFLCRCALKMVGNFARAQNPWEPIDTACSKNSSRALNILRIRVLGRLRDSFFHSIDSRQYPFLPKPHGLSQLREYIRATPKNESTPAAAEVVKFRRCALRSQYSQKSLALSKVSECRALHILKNGGHLAGTYVHRPVS